MPNVREVYEMVTKQKPSDPGALERQRTRQVRTMRNRKVGAFAVAAAIGVAAAVVLLGTRDGQRTTDVGANPSPSTVGSGPVGAVTSDGSTCSIDITADVIEPGFVTFRVVNDGDIPVKLDSWWLAEDYTFDAFERAVARDLSLAERGEHRGAWPDEDEVTYLRSDVAPRRSSTIIAVPVSRGTNAITCLKFFEGLGDRPYGIAGPIVVR